MGDMRPFLIDRLLDPQAFPHPVEPPQIVETHISWVILTGEYAYKIKKPVNLGFLDFTSLERRKHYCEEELRLNRRTTPELYLGVVPIAETPAGPRVGEEPAVEYAVRMRQFPASARLDRQLESGRLRPQHLRTLAKTVADFHLSLPPLPVDDPVPMTARLTQFALDNFTAIRAAYGRNPVPPLLPQIEAWMRKQIERMAPVFANRALQGFIRECHGDLHLANTARLAERIILFDCLEFDADLRNIDLMNDAGFLVMDLMAHGRDDLAIVFLNDYLEHTGDYAGLAVIRFYLVYRCMVRAKVAAMQPEAINGVGKHTLRYLQLANRLAIRSRPPRLLIMHGFSGVGKTWLGDRLISAMPAIRVRSDLERKRLHGLQALDRSDSGLATGLYASEVTDRTYQHLADCCEAILRARFDVIADATFLRHWQRSLLVGRARHARAVPVILDCTASIATLRQRIRRRLEDPCRVSEAGEEVLDYQLSHHEKLVPEECRITIPVNLEHGVDLPLLVHKLRSFQGTAIAWA
jgi:aminoglycoside phosphotransferase family enzyme/predicted kinase